MRAFLTIGRVLGLSALAAVPSAVMAAGAIEGEAVRQPTNWTAILMFGGFVAMLVMRAVPFITVWPTLTCPSPATTTSLPRRTARIVVMALLPLR